MPSPLGSVPPEVLYDDIKTSPPLELKSEGDRLKELSQYYNPAIQRWCRH